MLMVLAVIIRSNLSETSKTDVFLEEECIVVSWLI